MSETRRHALRVHDASGVKPDASGVKHLTRQVFMTRQVFDASQTHSLLLSCILLFSCYVSSILLAVRRVSDAPHPPFLQKLHL